MNLHWITHLETFAANAKFYKLVSGDPWAGKSAIQRMTDPKLPHNTLMLRVQNEPSLDNWLDDLPMNDQPAFAEWKSLRTLIARARKAISFDPVLGPLIDLSAPLGRVVISVLQPRSTMMWHSDLGDYAKRHFRFHVSLVTNPRCFLYCGAEALHVPQGSLVYLNAVEQHCAVNFGEAQRSHLIFELRRRDANREGEE